MAQSVGFALLAVTLFLIEASVVTAQPGGQPEPLATAIRAGKVTAVFRGLGASGHQRGQIFTLDSLLKWM